jgi:uncharacterized protein YndB with AHSA1/START domain
MRALETTPWKTEFVYATYIRTTPERLWQALTDPAFTRRYWAAGLHSDWRVGSPVLWQEGPDEEPRDLDQVVLEAEPSRRLYYTCLRGRNTPLRLSFSKHAAFWLPGTIGSREAACQPPRSAPRRAAEG